MSSIVIAGAASIGCISHENEPYILATLAPTQPAAAATGKFVVVDAGGWDEGSVRRMRVVSSQGKHLLPSDTVGQTESCLDAPNRRLQLVVIPSGAEMLLRASLLENDVGTVPCSGKILASAALAVAAAPAGGGTGGSASGAGGEGGSK